LGEGVVGYAQKRSDHTQKGNRRVARKWQLRQSRPRTDDKDVLLLLKAAIEQDGSISAFAKRHGQQRTSLNNMLNGIRQILPGCCARATSGQPAAAPPRSVMNPRRSIAEGYAGQAKNLTF
jgi:DNA-binding transcriptional regulator YdaS (Cro superfamily)